MTKKAREKKSPYTRKRSSRWSVETESGKSEVEAEQDVLTGPLPLAGLPPAGYQMRPRTK
jgi:hypothetical protein